MPPRTSRLTLRKAGTGDRCYQLNLIGSNGGQVRYVIIAVTCALFLAWDLIYNHSQYIAQGVRMLNHAFRAIGLI